jgi:asparagine synthase (glutamine-hydrolysing)
MCGLAGIIGRVDEPNRAALARMSKALVHRGPDAEGAWSSAPDERGWGALLAHRRLAILDLSAAGAQPMHDPATGDVLAYNGEVYDYVALRERLAAEGERFHSTGDTEVVLRALSRHGLDALSGLRGMFALAFWDRARRRLVLARDPLGQKPLYLARNPDPDGEWSFAFASEVRALLASGLLGAPRLDPSAVASVVWNGFVVAPGTAVAGVELLWPGEARVLEGREVVATHRFWAMPRREASGKVPDARLAEALQESVRLHLASDVPLAVFLSGGVDSASVANLAARASPTPVHTFTLAFDEPEYDERPVARAVAAAIGSRHQEVVLTEDAFVRQLDAAVSSLDQPTFDGLNSYYLARAVRDAGFTVALVGTGGDELFGGYTSFRDLPVLQAWLARTAWVPAGVRAAAGALAARALQPARGAVAAQTRWAKLPELARAGNDLLALYQLAYALFLPELQRELLGDAATALPGGLPPALRARLSEEISGRSPLATIAVLEQRLFLGERLLRDSDAASMAASLELRLPLVDQVLLERTVQLDDDARFQPLRAKSMLRRHGLRGLDPALFDRPKSGFVLPYDRWIRRGLSKPMDEALRDPAAVRAAGLEPETVGRVWRSFLDGNPGIYWSRVWALYVLVRWCREHGIQA